MVRPSVFCEIIGRFGRGRYFFNKTVLGWLGCKKRKSRLSIPEHISHVSGLWRSEADLFSAIVSRFSGFVKSKGATPVLMLQHQAQWLCLDYGDNPPPWLEALDKVRVEQPDLIVFDTWEWLREGNTSELYTAGSEGHHTAYANKLIAKRLAEELGFLKNR
jgi:hypothetical protein